MNIEDRRVRKTKKALREGLAELMLEKELRGITVRELTDKVDIHRATFYAHYKDIFDLYEHMEDAVIDELSAIIVSAPAHSNDGVFNAMMDYVQNNANLCRVFFGNYSFYERISAFLEDKYLEIFQSEMGKAEISKEWRFIVRYHLQGCLAMIDCWVEEDFAYPKEQLTRIIMKADENMDKLL